MIGHFENMPIGPDKPLDLFFMGSIKVNIIGCPISDHIQKVLEEVEPVVEIDAFVRKELELRD